MADLGSSLASLMQVPGLQELLNSAITQQRQNAPLRTAINQQAANMLPNSAFGAGGRPNMSAIPSANFAAPQGGTDWTKILGLLAAGTGGAAALAKLLGGGGSSSGGNLSSIVNGLKKLFGHGGSSGTNGNTGQPTGLNFGPFDGDSNPYPDWLNTGSVSPTDRSGGTPGVSTDYNFNSDPNLGRGGPDDAGGTYGVGGGGYEPGDWNP